MNKSSVVVEKVRGILNKILDKFESPDDATEYFNGFGIDRTGPFESSEAIDVLYDLASRDDVLVCWDDQYTGGDDFAYFVVPMKLVERMVVLGGLP